MYSLIFLQGYAHMTSTIGKEKSPEFGSASLSGVFSVEWIKKYVCLSDEYSIVLGFGFE